MLKGLDPLLGPELLSILCAMGHGDEIALVDANFPATALASRLVRADGHPLVRVLDAVLSVIPLDSYDGAAAFTMAVVDDVDAVQPVVADIRTAVARHGHAGPVAPLDRSAFYQRARTCFAIVATGEQRLYGNVIVRKGVLCPAPAC